ncbi:putative adenylyltransferase/sulfurtransferase MoeZ [compost metagenome]
MFGFGSRVPQVSSRELAELLGQPDVPLIVDVREPNEFAGGHIPGSRLIPLGSLASRMGELPGDREVVVVCRSGARSTNACGQLQAAGYRAKNLTGGLIGWRGPLER